MAGGQAPARIRQIVNLPNLTFHPGRSCPLFVCPMPLLRQSRSAPRTLIKRHPFACPILFRHQRATREASCQFEAWCPGYLPPAVTIERGEGSFLRPKWTGGRL